MDLLQRFVFHLMDDFLLCQTATTAADQVLLIGQMECSRSTFDMRGLECLVEVLLVDCLLDETNDLLDGNGEDSGAAFVKGGFPFFVASQVLRIGLRL